MEDSYYKAAIETMREALLVVDTQGTILSVNPAFEVMTGYSCRELVGKPCTVLNCTGCKIMEREAESLGAPCFPEGGSGTNNVKLNPGMVRRFCHQAGHGAL